MSCNYSIIIPAYNEQDYLPSTLRSVKAAMEQNESKGELIVVDNNSTDNTALIAKDLGARVVHEKINQISRARNCGAHIAMGKNLIFIDADTTMSPELLNVILQKLNSGFYCGGGARVDTLDAISSSYQGLLKVWNIISTRMNLAAGSLVFCLKEGFEKVGGFSEEVYAGEEIGFSSSLKSWGKRHNLIFEIITDYPVYTSMRKAEWYSPTELFVLTIPILIFPPSIFFKKFCQVWYKRPG